MKKTETDKDKYWLEILGFAFWFVIGGWPICMSLTSLSGISEIIGMIGNLLIAFGFVILLIWGKRTLLKWENEARLKHRSATFFAGVSFLLGLKMFFVLGPAAEDSAFLVPGLLAVSLFTMIFVYQKFEKALQADRNSASAAIYTAILFSIPAFFVIESYLNMANLALIMLAIFMAVAIGTFYLLTRGRWLLCLPTK